MIVKRACNSLISLVASRMALVAVTVLIASCGGGGGSSSTNNDSSEIDSGSGQSEPVSQTPDTSIDDDLVPTDCAELLDGATNIPADLVNFSSACDYYVDGTAVFRSDVNIEPGTVFLMAEDSAVSFQSGTLIAQGTEALPIVFRGEEPITGYWRGISFQNMRGAELEHVIVSDGGQQENAGILVASGPLTLDSVEVSNSFGYGLFLQRKAVLEQFSNNRFFANRLAGIFINGDIDASVAIDTIAQFDETSDYSGGDQPNGRPVVQVNNFNIMGGEFTLPVINAAWEIINMSVFGDGQLVVPPGSRLQFSGEGTGNQWHDVLGEFRAEGTTDDPIIFERAVGDPEPYPQFLVQSSNARMILDHVQMSGGGKAIGLTNNTGLVTLGDGALDAQNTLFADSDSWGVFCREETSGLPIEISLTDVSFDNNASGDTSPECGF